MTRNAWECCPPKGCWLHRTDTDEGEGALSMRELVRVTEKREREKREMLSSMPTLSGGLQHNLKPQAKYLDWLYLWLAELYLVQSFIWLIYWVFLGVWGFPRGSVVKNPPTNARVTGDVGSIPGSGRSPGAGNGNPLQYSCLENLMDRGTWWASVHLVAKNQTRLCMHAQLDV